MRISIVKKKDEKSLQLANQLVEKCQAVGFIYDEENPEIVISVGGDGTLLKAFHKYTHLLDQVRFVGVHTGHLGFYTDWRDYELDELVASLVHDEGKSVSYPLLDVEVNYLDPTKEALHYYGLNEANIKQVGGTMVLDVLIKDEWFERFRGDGICVSTPSGSTGYNKSLGGAVIHPRLEALQLTEIASINNMVFRTISAPMIIAPDQWITIKPAWQSDFMLSIDQFTSLQQGIDSIQYKIADKRIHFAHYRHTPFWRRVGDAFIGVPEQDEI